MAILFCVVCGQSSSRSVWNTQIGAYVACDFHSIADVQASITNAGGAPSVGEEILHLDPAVPESPQA